jgi:hypothetical protein
MAVWQYTFNLVSEDIIASHKDKDLLKLENDFSNKITLLKLEKHLNFIKKKENTWGGGEILTYGDIDDNDIKVYLKNDFNTVSGVVIRYSLRKNDLVFFHNIIKLANDLDCYFLDNDGRVVLPDQQHLAQAILESRAFKFVADPEKFISDFVKNNPKPASDFKLN